MDSLNSMINKICARSEIQNCNLEFFIFIPMVQQVTCIIALNQNFKQKNL